MTEGEPQTSEVVRGASRLAFDAIEQVSLLVEQMHANISAASPALGKGTDGRTRGITGLVYGGVRLGNSISRSILDQALKILPSQNLATLASPSSPHSDAARSALNGVMGDTLFETENPLAIPMRLRRQGQPLTLDRDALTHSIPEASGKILIVVHGLCMNDRQWKRDGHDHAAELAREGGYTPVYLNYNSGRHVSENGRDLASILERLVEAWPVPVTELSVLAHSMGGLLTRSAVHYGGEAGHRWLATLRRIAFLGTPHHGAPLERGGQSFTSGLEFSPYTAPFARLTWLRSAGITDLRHGNLLDEDWHAHDRFETKGDMRRPLSLPPDIECYALAATTGKIRGNLVDRLLGDGLVPVASALGQHRDVARDLGFPESHQSICTGINHMELLSDSKVYAELRDWLV